MNDDELFAADLKKSWGAPRPAPQSLRVRVLSAAATPMRRRPWLTLSAAAAMLVAATWVGVVQRGAAVADDELTWFADSDEESADVASYFDLAAVDD